MKKKEIYISLVLAMFVVLFLGRRYLSGYKEGDDISEAPSQYFTGDRKDRDEKPDLKKVLETAKIAKNLEDRRKALESSYEDEHGEEQWLEMEMIMDEMLEEQEENIEWSRRVTLEASVILSEKEFSGTRLSKVECKKTLCKMVLTHNNEEGQQYLAKSNFSHRGSWDGDQYGRGLILRDGTLATYIYFTEKDDAKPFIEARDRLMRNMENRRGS